MEIKTSFQKKQLNFELLKSNYVFIDTNIFDGECFHFSHGKLALLKEACTKGNIKVLITRTVDGEVSNHISQKMKELSGQIKAARKNSLIIESIDVDAFRKLAPKIDSSVFEVAGLKAWENYKIECSITVIDSSPLESGQLLEMYFKSLPPFQKGDKKNEFPDALSVIDIENWKKISGNNLYVLSKDDDFRLWAEKADYAYHLTGLDELLSIYTYTKDFPDKFKDLFSFEIDSIANELLEKFGDCEFYDSNNFSAEFSDIHIHEFNVVSAKIINVSQSVATISSSTLITFDAEVCGDDYENSFWDSEEKDYAFLPTFKKRKTYSDNFHAALSIEFDPISFKIKKISNIEFGSGNVIWVNDNEYSN